MIYTVVTYSVSVCCLQNQTTSAILLVAYVKLLQDVCALYTVHCTVPQRVKHCVGYEVTKHHDECIGETGDLK